MPVTFTLQGSAAANYNITGEYYGSITKRAVGVIIDGEISKVYDKTSAVVFEHPGTAVLDSRNIDGENLGLYANYADNRVDVAGRLSDNHHLRVRPPQIMS